MHTRAQQADPLRPLHGGEPVGDAELRVAPLKVLLHGPLRDAQPPPDRAGRQAVGQQVERRKLARVRRTSSAISVAAGPLRPDQCE